MGDDTVVVCCGPSYQKNPAGETLYSPISAATCSQALVPVGDLQCPSICWRDSTAWQKTDLDILERVHWKASEMIKRLEYFTFNVTLEEVALLNTEKRSSYYK